MLGTKLKSSRKLTILAVIMTVMIPAICVVSQYWNWYVNTEASVESENHSMVVSREFLKIFLDAGYVLYNMESGGDYNAEDMRELLNESGSELASYERIYPFLDYRVKDEKGKDVAKSTADSANGVTEGNLSSFALGIVITYDRYGEPDVQIKAGEYKSEQSVAFREVINEYDITECVVETYDEDEEVWENVSLEKPKNRTYIYAMTQENLENYIDSYSYTGYYVIDSMVNLVIILILVVAVLSWLLPLLPFWNLSGMRIFEAPMEIAAAVFFIMTGILGEKMWWIAGRTGNGGSFLDFLIWTAVFAVTFWAAACLRQIYTLGVRTYMKEKVLCVRYGVYIQRAWKYVASRLKKGVDRCYHFIDHIDLSEKNNRTIFKIVAVNFVILALICTLWFGGILFILIYSVGLFLLLREYFNDLQRKYRVLLKATGEIAKGNLDTRITEDLGIFSPFKQEIQKIQTGFKKAVDEEVKSQRMKTELVTNVSHDLKTPLTAIITYVNLLKDEKDQEKQKDYIEVLERKSLRLKVLIEDLFEISKASSKNVTLNLVDADVVNLFKQVKLELEDKIAGADLDFRCVYPDEKVSASLDSQKTYRVFENLLVNIIKYAMPHTRVYIEITKEDGEAVIRMKNVSASELNFNPDEITERFVRGDVSRNTEGSGLGLAIAKSFVELQKGKFKIETEADLFKVEVRFRM